MLGPRTGYGDHEARARHEVTPARLVQAAGVRYDEFSNLHADLPLRATPGSPLTLSTDAVATRWVEGLAVDDADVLATYKHPHFGLWPAVTTRRHGAGRVTCVGTVPRPRARRGARPHGSHPPPRSGWRDLPDSVTVSTGTAEDGRRVHVVHNWSWEPVTVTVPGQLTDALDGGALPAGTTVNLRA